MGQLVRGLASDDWHVCRLAADVLCDIAPNCETLPSKLIPLLSDPRSGPSLQLGVCRVLASLGPAAADARLPLIDLIGSATSEVRGWAAVALARIGPEKAKIELRLPEPRDHTEMQVRATAATTLNEGSWALVRQPNCSDLECSSALRSAQAACALVTDNGNFVNTLGVAQYRNGKYRDALSTLTRSNALNRTDNGGALPTDVAFLAMAHHRAGHTDTAQSILEQLRQLLQLPRWSRNRQCRDFLREAEALINPPRKNGRQG